MFLDDKLLEICKNAEVETPEQMQELNKTIYSECEAYYKSKISPMSKSKEVKSILDKTFNLFDSFVQAAMKSDDGKLTILGTIFKKYSFKYQFLQNEDLARVYYDL